MGGGLMQLVAYGAQDIYLTGNPQITFFKIVYRRHTHFAIESIEQTFNGEADFGKKFTVTIARNGDLLGNITLEVDLGLNLENLFENSDKVGDYKYSSKTTDFKGWIKCNGRVLDKRRYWRLFNKIGYSFDTYLTGTNYFRLPDARSKVLGNIGQSTIYDKFAYDIDSNIFTMNSSMNDKWITGMAITFDQSGVDVSQNFPMNSLNTRYLIKLNNTQFRLASTLSGAVQYSNINNTSESFANDFIGNIYHTFSNRIMGMESGEETHGLTLAELNAHNHGTFGANGQIPTNDLTSNYTHDHGTYTSTNGSHNHTGNTSIEGSHDHSGSTSTNGLHSHNYKYPTSQGVLGGGTDDAADDRQDVFSTLTTTDSGSHAHTISTDGSHLHNISTDGDHNHVISSDTHNHTINAAGGDLTHNNMQPTLFAGNLFIYAGTETDIEKGLKTLKDYMVRWGFQLIDFVEIEIGGQLIDKQYGEWMDIWTQLSYTKEKYEQLLNMINTSIFSSISSGTYDRVAKVYIPLQFWFCRNPGLYLPLIALQYHEVKLNIQLNQKSVVNTACAFTSNIVKINNFDYTSGEYSKINYIESIEDLKIFCEYIYLDTDERRRFAQVSHEYLIEQVQSSSVIQNDHRIIDLPLYFNHPCKLLVWRAQRSNPTYSYRTDVSFNDEYFLGSLYEYNAYGSNTTEEGADFIMNSDTIKTVKLLLNGVDRFKSRDGSYFRTVQPNYFLKDKSSGLSFFTGSNKRYGGGFYMYNFSLYSDEHHPSGTCNFSRLDNAVLNMVVNPYSTTHVNLNNPGESTYGCYNYNFRVYAMNYNVLRVMSGMGGLAYSN